MADLTQPGVSGIFTRYHYTKPDGFSGVFIIPRYGAKESSQPCRWLVDETTTLESRNDVAELLSYFRSEGYTITREVI